MTKILTRSHTIDNKVPNPRETGALTVFYDGACPLCRREIAYYKQQTAIGRIDWMDANNNPAQLKIAGITKAEALARLHVITTEGDILSGTRAFQKIWETFPKFRILAICLNYSPLHLLVSKLYEQFLKYRPFLQKLCMPIHKNLDHL